MYSLIRMSNMTSKTETKSYKRRKMLSTLGVLGSVGLAGCAGEDSEDPEVEGDSDGWIPTRNLIDFRTPSDPGGQMDTLPRIWGEVAVDHYEEILGEPIDYTITAQTAGAGVAMLNDMANSYEAEDGILGVEHMNSIIVNEIGQEQANYNAMDLRYPAQLFNSTRGIQVNPRTFDVDGHFQLTWDEFCDEAEDRGLTWPFSNAAQRFLATLVREWEPRLNEDNFQFVQMDGGGEARAAIQRGDMDGYFGVYAGNLETRNDFYYTQFVWANPEADPDFVDSLRTVPPEDEVGDFSDEEGEWLPDDAIMMNTSYDTEDAQTIADIVQDPMILIAPADTSDEIYDIHVEALSQTGEDERTVEGVVDAFNEFTIDPLVGEELENTLQGQYEAVMEDDEVRELAENVF